MTATVFPGQRPQALVANANAAPLPIAASPLTGTGAQHAALELGASYEVQPIGAAVWVGFGVDAATADTNGAAGVGRLVDSYDVYEFTVLTAACQYISRTPDSGTTNLTIKKKETQ